MKWLSGAILCAILISSACAQEPVFIGLGDLPGGDFGSWAYDVSADGSVVTGSSIIRFPFLRKEAFRWTRSSGLVALGNLPGGGIESHAWAISPNGRYIAGASSSDVGWEAFLWSDEDGMIALGELPGGDVWSVANVVSDEAIVVGYSPSEASNTLSEAFRWTRDAGMIDLGFLPQGRNPRSGAAAVLSDGRVLVSSSTDERSQPFWWTKDAGMQGIDWDRSVRGCTPDGSVLLIGVPGPGGSGSQPALWFGPDQVLPLGEIPDGLWRGVGWDLSDDASVVVGDTVTAPGFTATMWTAESGMRSLSQAILEDTGIDVHALGWQHLWSATGVSADGRTVVGNGFNANGDFEGFLVFFGRPCIADFNGDGVVNTDDFVAYLDAFTGRQPAADINTDGIINIIDFIAFLNAYNAGCE